MQKIIMKQQFFYVFSFIFPTDSFLFRFKKGEQKQADDFLDLTYSKLSVRTEEHIFPEQS